jgi:nitroreductase
MQATDEQPIKFADTDYPIHKLLRKRWSPRSFSEKSIDEELIYQLFEAARWAPSSYNEQPWRFIYATKQNQEDYQKLASLLIDFNQRWATNAPLLVLGITKTTFDLDSRPNQHAKHDLGQAIAHLTFEATRNDLYVHQMAGFSVEKTRKTYDIADPFVPTTMFAIGYLGNPESLEDKIKRQETSPRNRKSMNEIVFEGNWENG